MKNRTFYRLLLKPFGFVDKDFNTLEELKEEKQKMIKDLNSEYFDYWLNIYNKCKVVKVTEIYEEIE